MRVIVDDHFALLANLGVLELPQGIELPLFTVYSFQLRLASALSPGRETSGRLQRLRDAFGPDVPTEALVSSRSRLVEVLDPREYVVEIAAAKLTGANALGAEVIAAAGATGAEVRLSAGNEPGQLRERVQGAGARVAIWIYELGSTDTVTIREVDR